MTNATMARRNGTAAKANGWYQGFVLHAREEVERLRDGTGWEVEYPRDVWRLHTLPGLTHNAGKNPEARNHLRFDRIAQPWLRELVKRWARLRLSSGLAIGTVVADIASLIRFSSFLTHLNPPVTALAQVDRSLLERYLAWQRAGRRHSGSAVGLRFPRGSTRRPVRRTAAWRRSW